MKYFLYNSILVIIILLFSYYNTIYSVETFTPSIKGIYRPIVRNTRIIGEGFYNKTTSNISNLFRKFGIM
uniref:Uncharacterized protein n=1 Tax=viral metagenome TaxID=1070528 RepID=A0A6C0AQH8_9ZZZZ